MLISKGISMSFHIAEGTPERHDHNRRAIPETLEPISRHEITRDKDTNNSRYVQQGGRCERIVEPLDGVQKMSRRDRHESPPFSHRVSAVAFHDRRQDVG